MTIKVKGISERNMIIIFEMISYILATAATLSWMNKNPDLPIILLLVAGAIDKYIKRLFITPKVNENENH